MSQDQPVPPSVGRQERIQEIRARWEDATEGPWEDIATLLLAYDAALARAETLEAELSTLRAQRVEQGLRAGQLLGPDFDGASLDDVAAEVVRLRAQTWQDISEHDGSDAPILGYYDRYCEHLTVQRAGRGWCVAGISEHIAVQAPTRFMPLPPATSREETT